MMIPALGKDVAYDATPERMAEQLAILMPALRDKRMRSYGQTIADFQGLVVGPKLPCRVRYQRLRRGVIPA
jgi:hypothetical protein